MDQPVFSVVTIFLNASRFLLEAVDSVFMQDHSSWELLLVDDGSTDGSDEVARALSAREPRVRYLEHPGHQNRGMGASRNLGLAHARGQYLACLDSDDAWFPDTLSRHVAMLDPSPEAAMSYGSAYWWYSWEGPDRADWCDGAGNKVGSPNSLVNPPDLATLFLRDGGAVPCWCSVAFRTEAVREAGGFDESFRDPLRDLYEDQVIFSKLFLERPVFVTDAILGRYRQHADQACARADDAMQTAARSRFLNWLADYIDERGIDDRELRAALDDAIAAMASAAGAE